MLKLSPKYQIIIAAAAGGALLIGCIIPVINAVKPEPEVIPVVLETEMIAETKPVHPVKERLPVAHCTYNLANLSYQEQVYRYVENGLVTFTGQGAITITVTAADGTSQSDSIQIICFKR